MWKSMKLLLSYIIHKIKLKTDLRHECKIWNIKNLGEKKAVTSLTSALAIISFFFFFICHLRESNKSKNTNKTYIKLKIFCIAKEITNKIKRKPTESNEILTKNIPDKKNRGAWWATVHGDAKSQTQFSNWTIIPDKGLISKIYNIFPKKKNADSQQAHEKVLNITDYQGNANQNQNELSLYTCQNSYCQIRTRFGENVEKENPCTLLVGKLV